MWALALGAAIGVLITSMPSAPKDKIRAATVLGVVIVDPEAGVDSDLAELPAEVPRLLAHPKNVQAAR